jgi:regulator of cell morphogenesis and NO signaling
MLTSTQSIREIISTQPSAAAVLDRFEIDLCSRAGESLTQACAELQLSIDQILEKLSDAAASERGDGPADLTTYSLARLIQHIVRTHHQYVRRELPRLAQMAHKLAGKHGAGAPELMKVEALNEALHAEMSAHLQKEEQILFPFIAQMEEATNGYGSSACACFRTVAQPISMMVLEHELAEGLVAEMSELTNDFHASERACPTHIALYSGLKSFEADLRQHVHLENDLQFPRTIKMESMLNPRGEYGDSCSD